MEVCPTCRKVREYRYCLDRFHDVQPPNPMLDAFNAIRNHIDGPPFRS